MHEARAPVLRELICRETTRCARAWPSLIDQAERNHAIMMRHQAFDLDIVGAGSFPGAGQHHLPPACRSSADLDIVTLSLVDDGADIHTVMHKLGVDFERLPEPAVLSKTPSELGFELGRDVPARPSRVLVLFDHGRHGTAFPHPPAGLQASRWCRCCATSA